MHGSNIIIEALLDIALQAILYPALSMRLSITSLTTTQNLIAGSSLTEDLFL